MGSTTIYWNRSADTIWASCVRVMTKLHEPRIDGGTLGLPLRRCCRRGCRHHRYGAACRTHAAFATHAPAADARAWQVPAALHHAGAMLPRQPSASDHRWLAWQHVSARGRRSHLDLSATRPVRTASASNPARTHAPASERLLTALTISATLLRVPVAGHRQAVRHAHYVRAVRPPLLGW